MLRFNLIILLFLKCYVAITFNKCELCTYMLFLCEVKKKLIPIATPASLIYISDFFEVFSKNPNRSLMRNWQPIWQTWPTCKVTWQLSRRTPLIDVNSTVGPTYQDAVITSSHVPLTSVPLFSSSSSSLVAPPPPLTAAIDAIGSCRDVQLARRLLFRLGRVSPLG